MTYNKLLYEAESQGVEVVEMKFNGKCKGLYGDNVIALNKNIETLKEKRCILAEELGHHYTSSGNILDNSNISNLKQEKRARNWGYEKLIGIIDIINAFNAGTKNRYEMAEYLEVTEDFLELSIQHYKEKYGVLFEIDNYIIYFEPNFGIMKKF
ncbi:MULTISPECIES: ImmA/IrrE family metallo-endopeptidase [Clostridium]|uniref:Membrane protein n=1 Tax=Clostridium botulinum B2 450 TaxID=1379739 RepID=A0A0D1BX11_CLOBO|nr:ImmA/IrrE family metallo-endopeptidase [Clostridium botulinum]KIS24910.1 membrane protein [Clostridium botulinum B2 450]MDU5116570.1 ImmA/IrrE family metallo-endopeptidase [Clostridium botulinum]